MGGSDLWGSSGQAASPVGVIALVWVCLLFIAQFLGITPFTLSPHDWFFLCVPLSDSGQRHLFHCTVSLGFFLPFQMCMSSRTTTGMETSVKSSIDAQL